MEAALLVCRYRRLARKINGVEYLYAEMLGVIQRQGNVPCLVNIKTVQTSFIVETARARGSLPALPVICHGTFLDRNRNCESVSIKKNALKIIFLIVIA